MIDDTNRVSSSMLRRARVVVAVITMTAFIAACGDDSGGSANAKPTIRIAQNAWSASKVDAALAAILLAEQLGFRVEVTDIDENAQWPAIAKGDLHACLEVWPSGHRADIQQYVDEQRSVEDGGPLGPVGKIGWYIPAYLLDTHPELATYVGFKNPDNVALFRTPETATKGRFLSADPSFVQFDEQIIRNLGLDLTVVFAGSEEAVLAQVDAAYRRLSPDQAITVVLRFHLDLTLDQVAARMGVPVGTVKSRLNSALHAMYWAISGAEVIEL